MENGKVRKISVFY